MNLQSHDGCGTEKRKMVGSRYSISCNRSYWKGEEGNPFVAIFERPTDLESKFKRPVCCDTGK